MVRQDALAGSCATRHSILVEAYFEVSVLRCYNVAARLTVVHKNKEHANHPIVVQVYFPVLCEMLNVRHLCEYTTKATVAREQSYTVIPSRRFGFADPTSHARKMCVPQNGVLYEPAPPQHGLCFNRSHFLTWAARSGQACLFRRT